MFTIIIVWLYRSREKYLKNGVSKGIVHVIKHSNFKISGAYPAEVISKHRQLTTKIRVFLQ